MSAIDFEAEADRRMNWMDLTGGPADGGLTVLDAFAMRVMPVAKQIIKETLDKDKYFEESGWGWDAEDFQHIAEMAYDLAEAMLEERNKRFTPQGTVRGVTGKHYG